MGIRKPYNLRVATVFNEINVSQQIHVLFELRKSRISDYKSLGAAIISLYFTGHHSFHSSVNPRQHNHLISTRGKRRANQVSAFNSPSARFCTHVFDHLLDHQRVWEESCIKAR